MKIPGMKGYVRMESLRGKEPDLWDRPSEREESATQRFSYWWGQPVEMSHASWKGRLQFYVQGLFRGNQGSLCVRMRCISSFIRFLQG